MSDVSFERRDVAGSIADIRVNVAAINERTIAQGKTLDEVKDTLRSSVSRGEYEAKHREVDEKADRALKIANESRDDALRRQGADRVWKAIFSGALTVLGIVVALIQAKII